MSDPLQNQTNSNLPPPGNVFGDAASSFPEDGPVASPSDFFPPVMPSSNAKKFAGGRIVATFLGILLLVGGLGLGVVLVEQPQLLKQSASEVLSACENDVICADNNISGSTKCTKLATAEKAYCCPKGSTIENSACKTVVAVCASGLDCSTSSNLSGSTSCSESETNTLKYCCPADFKVAGETCVHK